MLFRTSASVLFLVACASTPRMSRPLSCDVDESVALKTAASGASRGPEHELRVGWKAGTGVFRDSGVVAGDMGGIDYRYCGYDPRSGFHLVFKHDNELFTGLLFEQATGRLLPAGQRVLFAPDEDRYFATAQPDGLDGEEWHIYSIRRGELWRGVSSIPARDSSVSFTYNNAELTNPHWSAGGELQATLTCRGSPRSEPVTLRNQGAGYAWLPVVACPPTKFPASPSR